VYQVPESPWRDQALDVWCPKGR